MTYLVIKALHLVAIMLFVGGMLVLALALKAYQKDSLGVTLRQQIVRWDRFATSPALGLVWVLGISLAVMGDWFPATWLHLKFAIVFLLSGLHGTLSGRLKSEKPPSPTSRLPGLALTGLLASVPVIIFLATLKPWL